MKTKKDYDANYMMNSEDMKSELDSLIDWIDDRLYEGGVIDNEEREEAIKRLKEITNK